MAEEQLDINIPGHRILRRLGTGGMANVYLAIQESMEREVALKIMHPSLGATDPAFSERFVREAKIAAKLSHPHVNAVHDVGVSGQYHYITMEYIKGGDLKSRIRQGMPPRAALAIVRQIAEALAFAHAKGYVHRDVKPENVLFRDSGTAVLTDFGIAKANDNSMTATGTVVGTPYYMSPEQAMGRAADKRSDLYSLGAMLFEMLTGKVPYTGDSAISIGIKHLKDPIPQLPSPLRAYQPLIDRFMAKNPAQRFQTAEEAVAAIDAGGGGENGSALSATIVRPSAERTLVLTAEAARAGTDPGAKTRSRWPIMTTALLIVLIAGAAVYVASRKPVPPAEVAAVPAPAPVEPTAASAPAKTDERVAQIAQLLAQADDAARAGQYFEPAATAAVPRLRQVLAIEPDNPRAARALSEIAGEFIGRAEHAIEKKDFDQAEMLLGQAEQADPNHPMLFSRRLALREYREKQARDALAAASRPRATAAPRTASPVPPRTGAATTEQATGQPPAGGENNAARDARERESKLQVLLARFRDLVTPASLTVTRAGLAQDVLAEATRVAPDDSRVRALPGALADAYLKLATVKIDAKEYDEASALIRRGLELRPGHEPLLALQRDISERKNRRPQTFGSF